MATNDHIEINGRAVGRGRPCYIIAEAGVNHNGDVELAKRLVRAAHEAGADAVKFQTWITDEIVAPSAPMADYQKSNTDSNESQYEMLSRLQLSQNAFREIKAYAEKIGITFLSTPDESRSADFLDELGVSAFKIGSGELDNLSFLAHIARFHRPIILSTGMGWLSEVERAVETIRDGGNQQIVLLHCVSNYPANPAASNLRAMSTMAEVFRVPVGFSDHCLGMNVSLAAVALGACVVEKHLTLDRQMSGPDHLASIEPNEFRRLVDGIREVESALGNGVKQPVSDEAATRAVVRKVAVTRRSLSAGHMLAESDIVLRRAAGGVSAAEIGRLPGRVLKVDLPENMPVTFESLV